MLKVGSLPFYRTTQEKSKLTAINLTMVFSVMVHYRGQGVAVQNDLRSCAATRNTLIGTLKKLLNSSIRNKVGSAYTLIIELFKSVFFAQQQFNFLACCNFLKILRQKISKRQWLLALQGLLNLDVFLDYYTT